MYINQVELSGGLGGRYDDVLEEAVHFGSEGNDLFGPRLILKSLWAEIVVEDHATFRELDLAHRAHLTIKGNSVFRKSGTK